MTISNCSHAIDNDVINIDCSKNFLVGQRVSGRIGQKESCEGNDVGGGGGGAEQFYSVAILRRSTESFSHP